MAKFNMSDFLKDFIKKYNEYRKRKDLRDKPIVKPPVVKPPINVPIKPPVVKPPVVFGGELRYHHTNSNAWDGRGWAIVFCVGQPKFDSVTFRGVELVRHASQDKDRDVWTLYHTNRNLTGEVVAIKGGKKYTLNTQVGLIFGRC